MSTRSPSRSGRGQASVELALCLPFVLLALLLVVQVFLVGRAQLRLDAAARAAARAAAVDPRVEIARAAAAQVAPDGSRSLELDRTGDLVVVRVGTAFVTDVPLVGPLVPTVALGASASFRLEAADGPGP